MKVTIHINHTEADDLAGLESAAAVCGLTVNRRGGFMGRHQTEFHGEMTPALLAQLLDAKPQASVAA